MLQAPVKGEPQLNVLPHQCRALLDIRTIPGQLHEVLKKQLEDIVREEERSVQESLHSGPLREIRESLEKGLSKGISFEAKLDIFEDRPWTKTPGMNRLFRRFQRPIKFCYRGGSDLRWGSGSNGWYFSLCLGGNSNRHHRGRKTNDSPSEG